jgi:hypothetical protein
VERNHGKKPEPDRRRELDALVYDWYGLSVDEAGVVERFFEERRK